MGLLSFVSSLFGGKSKSGEAATVAAAPSVPGAAPAAAEEVSPTAATTAPANTLSRVELDCRNQNCPMPIVQIASRIKTVPVGTELVVQATDPAFKADVEAWVRKTGQHLIDYQEKGGFVEAVILKKV